jgi:hypothetical protein
VFPDYQLSDHTGKSETPAIQAYLWADKCESADATGS